MNIDKLSIQLKTLLENVQKLKDISKDVSNEEQSLQKLIKIKQELEDNTCCGVCGIKE